MSVEVLSPKLMPSVSAPSRGAPKTSAGQSRTDLSYSKAGFHEGHSSSRSHHQPHSARHESKHQEKHHHHNHYHHHQKQQQHQQQQQQKQMDVSQNFDTDHIIYDSGTDTTYLRGRLLGKGGFARCYEVLNLSDNKIYAGKIISKSRITKPHQKQKILDEVALQRSLKHRHVVEFHSYFEDSSNVYIILENCSRKSLMHMMKQHRHWLTEPEVRYFMRHVVEGVQYVHAHRIIHRDLKLGNLLIDDNMDIKIADFGLATRVDFEGEKKMTVCGTPNYIAPEVLQKKGHSYEADIWAVGCTMYAMLVGRPPFETSSLTETYQRITRSTYRIPSHISEHAARLIQKCLSPKPHHRPSVHNILADEFFTSGYMPRDLSPSCCTTTPRFPDQPNHGKSRDRQGCLSPTPGQSGTDVAHAGNALSRMQLNSCSENLLKEKELQPIEKPSKSTVGPRSPKLEGEEDTGTSKTVTQSVTDAQGEHQVPASQDEVSVTPRSAAALLERLSACLETMPKEREENPEPVLESGIVWVTKWVDYSNKYGFGFRLSTNAMGVLFNDTSRMILAPDGRSVRCYDMTEKLMEYTLDSVPEDQSRKTTLLQYFTRYMDEHLIQGGDLESSQPSETACLSPMYLKKWFRTTKAIVLYLTDGTLQVNFFDDHAKLILSRAKDDYLMTFIDPERSAKTYSLALIAQHGCQGEIMRRMSFAHTMLTNLVDIEGADV